MFPFYINVFQRYIKLYLFIPFQFSLKIYIKKVYCECVGAIRITTWIIKQSFYNIN
jgi:hypothetical protein